MQREFSTPANLVLLLLASGALSGCWGGGLSRVKPPYIDAGGAAAEALRLYDKDGDGKIAGAELDAVPGIKAAMETIDANRDGAATAEEIEARIEAWQASKIGVMAVTCTFMLNGRPLDGATVTFEPESFLGDSIKAAVGDTSVTGSTVPSVPKEQRATADTPAGFQVGLYRIRISKMVNGQETLPAKFNAETTLGQQIAPDDPRVMSQNMTFKLTTP